MVRRFQVLLLASFATAVASADSVIFSASQGNLAASTRFETVGTSLVVTLTNTSAFDVDDPPDILTAVFFDVSGASLTLTPQSGVLGPGSIVLFDTPDPGGVVGGEWEYNNNFGGAAPRAAAYGISSAGFGLFGSGTRFPGSNLEGPDNVNGLQYGVTSAGDNPASGNAAVTGGNALIQSEVVLTLTGLPENFDINRISNVNWQYGTNLSEPNIPEPGTAGLLALSAFAALRRRI